MIPLLLVIIDISFSHGVMMYLAVDTPNAQLVLISNSHNGLYQGIMYAVENDADVICMPLAFSEYNSNVARAIRLAINNDIEIVAPLWNKDIVYRFYKALGVDMSKVYPAHYSGVIRTTNWGRGNSFGAAKKAKELIDIKWRMK